MIDLSRMELVIDRTCSGIVEIALLISMARRNSSESTINPRLFNLCLTMRREGDECGAEY